MLANSTATKPCRLPPACQGRYMVVGRGDVEFCIESTHIASVQDASGLKQTTAEQGGGIVDADRGIVDLAADTAGAHAAPLFIATRTQPAVHIAVDEIIHVSRAGVKQRCDATDTPVEFHKTATPFHNQSVIVDSRPLPAINPLAIETRTRLLADRSQSQPDVQVERPQNQSDFQMVERAMRSSARPGERKHEYDMVIVGGLGHVGLPLGISFARAGKKVVLYDVNKQAIETVKQGKMPFKEVGADQALKRTLNRGLDISADPESIRKSRFVVIVIGTPVDEHLNPRFSGFKKFIDGIIEHISDDQHIILRSTVYPGTTEKVKQYLESQGKQTRLSFCPERIAQGKAMEELHDLPQIVSSFDDESVREVSRLFQSLTKDIVTLRPTEAELAKLFCNVWRYIEFAISNQFYQTAAQHGLDFYRIFNGLKKNYPRLAGMPSPGFAAGPCLFKDTMQLAAFNNNSFFLGHAAMLINEGMPNFIVQRLKDNYPLNEMVVGVLGMAFKANNDDKRESLSYKFKKILEIEASRVICSDVYIHDPGFVEPQALVDQSDIIVVATPHSEYADLTIDSDKILVDIWNFYGRPGSF